MNTCGICGKTEAEHAGLSVEICEGYLDLTPQKMPPTADECIQILDEYEAKQKARIQALEARLKRAEELIREAVSVHNRQHWIKEAQSFLAEGIDFASKSAGKGGE